MTNSIWSGLEKIKEYAQDLANSSAAEKVDAMVSASLESIADRLPTASSTQLQEGALLAKEILGRVEREGDVTELSLPFIAGRLAAIADLLGYASLQTGDEAILEVAKTQPYARVLAALAPKPLRNVDLAQALQKDEAQISKWLTRLRELGGVTSQKRGRETFNALTPVGRLVFEKGIIDASRISLGDANICAIDAYRPNRFSLDRRKSPVDATPEEVPILSASGR